jgi:hypothetical protein
MLSKRVSGRIHVFHIPVLFKTHVCRCELFGDQPGPQSISKGPIRIVPTTMLPKRVSGRSTCSTDWPCSKPVCVDAKFLVISLGPNQSETDLFKSHRQRCFPKGFLAGVLFSNTGPGQDRVVPMSVFWRPARGPSNPKLTVSNRAGNHAFH